LVRGTCHICDRVFQENILDHVRLMHPDVFPEMETWPDGGMIFYEDPDITFPW
jgi:hypothetical protein